MTLPVKKYLPSLYTTLFLVLVLCLAIVPFFRFTNGDPVMPGTESYYHSRMSGALLSQGFIVQDPHLVFPYIYAFNPYHGILMLFSLVLGSVLASLLVPLLASLIASYYFYLLLVRYTKKAHTVERFCILLVFFLSPIFFSLTLISNETIFVMALLFSGLYFFSSGKQKHFWLSLVLFGIIIYTGLFHSIMLLLILLAFSFYDKTLFKQTYRTCIFLCLLLFFRYIPLFFTKHISTPPLKLSYTLFGYVISDLGASLGYSIFTLLIFLLGLMITWKAKKIYYSAYLFIPFIFLLSFFFYDIIPYVHIGMAIIGGLGLSRLLTMRWHFKQIRDLSLLLLFCGLLFSSLSFSFRLVETTPTHELIEGFTFLEEYDSENSIVLTHPDNSFWVQTFSHKKVLLDEHLAYVPKLAKVEEDMQTLFLTQDLLEAQQHLDYYNISYVIITAPMASGTVWQRENEGLHLLLGNKETFKKIYGNSEIGIWEYLAGVAHD